MLDSCSSPSSLESCLSPANGELNMPGFTYAMSGPRAHVPSGTGLLSPGGEGIIANANSVRVRWLEDCHRFAKKRC
jgi:hypothetical protein